MTARPGRPQSARSRLRTEVALASRLVAPVWPIETFIAVNPLGGLEHLPFSQAIAEAAETLGARGTLSDEAFRSLHAAGRVTDEDILRAVLRRLPELADDPEAAEMLLADLLHGPTAPSPTRVRRTPSEACSPSVAALVDTLSARWCAAFLDDGAPWAMPGRELGLYGAWRQLAHLDRSLPAATRQRLSTLPEHAEDAILDALEELGVGAAERRAVLEAHLTALPGWAGHVRWHAEQGARIDLVQLLAVRLATEAALLAETERTPAGPPPTPPLPALGERAAAVTTALCLPPEQEDRVATVLADLPVADRALVWLEAYEGHYRDNLLTRLTAGVSSERPAVPAAQLVFCIDVRSEGIRRHVEASGPYETLGFAGFFAVALRFRALAGGRSSAQCPVLLQPRNEVEERPADGTGALALRRLAGERTFAGAHESFKAAKDDGAAPFALAEAAGWVAGPLALARTTAAGAYGAARARLARLVAPPAPTEITVDEGFSPDEQALFAEAALTMMGLTHDFAPLVVLCGHGSTTENNPYGSALDCGACGGNRGAPNARAAAAILNRPSTRAALAERGIDVPATTWFVAAEHDTATDRVTLLDEHAIPPTHQEAAGALAADLDEASARLSAERCAALPGAPTAPSPRRARRHVAARSNDWAQVYPEWGLAGNAAFVVGPRAITAGLDLGRRVFLHSYDDAVDPDGRALETILTAPLVVAQWINCQYYFSTVEPEVLGAGTKTIHNVVGSLGVLSGYGGDLRVGLPLQSVAVGGRLVHEPMRLLAVVQAPLERIDRIVEENTVLRHLFGNGWVALAARAAEGDEWRRWTVGGWQPWFSSERSSTWAVTASHA